MAVEPSLSPNPVIFTICASNYLAHACVLGASVSEHHLGSKLVVFLLDALPADVALPETVSIVPAESAFDRPEWNHRRSHYNILEFATSVKPACFRYLFEQGAQYAIYLDPDIRVYQRVDPFWRGDAGDAELVLTPHILSPLPDDGCRPDDLDILRAGIYNLGFAALRNTPRGRHLLDWWDTKLRTLCLEDVKTGVFTDQKWMEYAPVLVPGTMVLQQLGFNSAYWNLHERTPRWNDGRWCMEGTTGDVHDLVFFHFSGFNPDLNKLSRHETRFGWELPGDTQRLFAEYGEALGNAGIARWRAIGVPIVTFADGTRWDPACRALYRQLQAEGLNLGDPLEDPDFLDWAASPAPADHVTRYVRAVLRMRPDLAHSFDDGWDLSGLMAWLRTTGPEQMGLQRELIERLGNPRDAARLNINYVGYLSSHLGVGEAARNSVAALDAAGIAVHTHDISPQAAAPRGDYALPGRRWSSGTAAATLLGCNADMLPTVLSRLPAELHSAYRIGCRYCETPTFPDEWSERFDLVDEIWAGTQFIAEAIRQKANVPVVVMPPMVMPPPIPRDRAWLSELVPCLEDDEFVFLFQFDAASVPFRKNPEGVIAAFAEAFSPQEPVRLIVKALNVGSAPDVMAPLYAGAQGHRVSFLTAALESTDRFRLLASVDSFVSLHRSEGFGLSIAEAMAYGLPVVATAWSGNCDFMHAGNSALVPCKLVPSQVAHGPYVAGTLWAEPDIHEAAQLMRRVWIDPTWRSQIARAGQETLASKLSANAVGSAMRARLETIAGQPRNRAIKGRAAGVSGPMLSSARRAAPLWARMARDMLRFPAYYALRMHRVPLLMWRYGVTGTMRRAEAVASGAVETKGKYLISEIMGRFRRKFQRWRRHGLQR